MAVAALAERERRERESDDWDILARRQSVVGTDEIITSRIRTARRPPVGRPLRQYIIDEYAENQRNFPSRRRGKNIGTRNLSESYQHGAIGGD